MSLNTNEHGTIRFSRPDDAAKTVRLAQLDGADPPQGRLLMAEVAGDLRAALPVDGGATVADPFGHTLALVALLELHRRQTSPTEREEICHDARPEQRSRRPAQLDPRL